MSVCTGNIRSITTTLYYLDERNFLPAYFDAIGKKAVQIGYDYEVACHAMYDGSINMSNSDGEKTNEQLFWEAFEKITGPLPKEDRNKFDSYYDTDFDKLKVLSKPIPGVKEIVKSLKEKGYVLVVATNPVLPMVAQLTRMNWAGLLLGIFRSRELRYTVSFTVSLHSSGPGWCSEVIGLA